MSRPTDLMDELERDLGLGARLRVLANAGGQARFIPTPDRAARSKLVEEFGIETVIWLAGRAGGDVIAFPSATGAKRDKRAALLRAAVLDAGLTDPSRSANDIAAEFGVTARHVHLVRSELRQDGPPSPSDDLPLFNL